MTSAPISPINVNDQEEIVSFIDMIAEFLAIRAGVVPESENGEFSDVEVEFANRQLVKALMSKSRKKYDTMLEALANGADDYETADDDGNTILHWAVMQGDTEIITFLINAGADLDEENNEGETARSLFAALKAE